MYNVDRSSLGASWQNGPYKNKHNAHWTSDDVAALNVNNICV